MGINLCDIKNGSTIKVKNVDFGEKSAVSFRAAIASEKKATMELHLDSANGPLIGTLGIDNTGGENIFKILSTDITNATGIHDLYMVFKGEDKVSLAKFDYWTFVDEKGADAIPDPTPSVAPSVAPTATPNVTETPAPTIVPSQTPALTQSSENKKIESPQPNETKKIKVAKVKGVKVTVTKAKKAKISWKKVKRAAGYQVMYSTDKKFKKAAVKITTKKANYVTKKLKKGKKYFIKVAAYRKDKAGKKVYGSFSAVKKIKVK